MERKENKYCHCLIISFLFITSSCVPLNTQQATHNKPLLVLEDKVYEDGIKNVLLYPPQPNNPRDVTQPAVQHIGDPLVLSFDHLSKQLQSYYVYLIPCNINWEKSNLLTTEFLNGNNNLPITEWEYFINTSIPYIHYTFRLPKLKITGNYVLVVYKGLDKENIMISHRLMIYNNLTSINYQLTYPFKQAGTREKKHQLQVSVNYNNLSVINPFQNFTLVIRQNQQWRSIHQQTRPNSVRQNTLFYDPIEGNNFLSPREFRSFSTENFSLSGKNVAKTESVNGYKKAILNVDRERALVPYVRTLDLNGNYVNSRQNNLYLLDYVYVAFRLQTPPIPQPIYIMGRFNLWEKNALNLLTYDSTQQLYTASLLLKQGYYDYLYYVEDDFCALEGCFAQADNEYDIFVYYTPPNKLNQYLLVGYTNFRQHL